MPIQCLTSIRFSFQHNEQSLPIDPRIAPWVAGIYTFEAAALPAEVALFNDGFPALMILPKESSSSVCRVGEDRITLGSMWFAAGALHKCFWLRPQLAAHEKLTIVRFFPSAWATLLEKKAVLYPYVHDFTAYHAAIAARFHRVYEAPSITVGLTDLLTEWYAEKLYDTSGYAFDPSALSPTMQGKHRQKTSEESAMANAHPKWIQRQFKQYVGLSPYQFEQLQRFIHAYHHLHEKSADNLHGVADSCGYYDANHLIKDFNKYLGVSPRQYFKEQYGQ